jgi:hypothetical protein
MGAVNLITFVLTVLTLAAVLIAESTPNWSNGKLKALVSIGGPPCEITYKFKEGLYHEWDKADFDPACPISDSSDKVLSVCSSGQDDDTTQDMCQNVINARGGSGAAVALCCILMVAQIVLMVVEAKGKPAAVKLLTRSSLWLFVGVSLAAFVAAGSWKRYHGTYISALSYINANVIFSIKFRCQVLHKR